MKQLLERLKAYGVVVINSAKCIFGETEVKFLGPLVSEKGIRPCPEKVDAIRNWPEPKTAKDLRRFLGTLNFNRRYVPNAAALQDPLNNLLQGNIKGNALLHWSDSALKASAECKESIASAVLLAYPEPDAPLAIFTHASDFAIGAVLQQRTEYEWQPLGFFSRKLSSAETKYGAFDRELLAIYKAIRYFRHMVEGRTFTIFTDHKPFTFAFRQKAEKCSRQFTHLDNIGQFTTDIRHISGKDNIVADALSRIMDVSKGIDFQALALSQDQDEELQNYLQPNSSLILTKVLILKTDVSIYYDVSSKMTRPFITKPFRKVVCDSLYQFSHPRINASVKLVTQRYVWPSIKADCRKWARACLDC